MAHSTETIIIAALSTLSSPHLSHLTHSISAVHHRHLCRLAAILSSPTLFSLSLRHLQSLSLHHKSLLIARHLLSNLNLLKSHFSPAATPPCSAARVTKLRDLDAVLLLLLLCELHHHDREFLDTPPSRWRSTLGGYVSDSILRLSSFGGCSNGEILIQFIESVRRCWNLVNVMGFGEGSKGGSEEAASPAAVVALPSVEVVGGGGECVICKEEMVKGREVCELPCGHLFHWVCILRWLRKTNTCPCCRRRLPTDDVRREIERSLEDFARIGGGGGGGL
ncbi:E3 ubiquitin-protein ligase sgr9 amyloplastic [Phtheirospermum japonicum]|uniref:RING-type E3 ubiquitin transferase n=1 Tax=Phtheirospermum japonicum TaxID=374723 RepID=A0A830CTD3_9LAMI|nr:E3 ubiquitin-protein ligase sgr9 amyloplastic [Phtheirospermum japonicum]